MVLIGGWEREYRGTHTGPHTGSVQFIFWAELRYLSLPAFVPSTAIPRAAFDVNGTNRPLLDALKRVDASRDPSSLFILVLSHLYTSLLQPPTLRTQLDLSTHDNETHDREDTRI